MNKNGDQILKFGNKYLVACQAGAAIMDLESHLKSGGTLEEVLKMMEIYKVDYDLPI